MMILDWNKSDGKQDDLFVWKAKLIEGPGRRVEIRRTFQHRPKQKGLRAFGGQMLIVVRGKGNLFMDEMPEIVLSGNGKLPMSSKDFIEMQMAVQEAKLKLETE